MIRRGLIGLCLLLVGVAIYLGRQGIQQKWYELTVPQLPPITEITIPNPGSIELPPLPTSPPPEAIPIPEKQPSPVPPPTRVVQSQLNLAVPFTSQAPHANWDPDHEEFCEEASLLMAKWYFDGLRANPSKDEAETELQKIKSWQIEKFGRFESTTAEETATTAREYLGLKVEVVPQLSLAQIKQTLIGGKLIVVPAAGQELHNPFFKQPGPIYHMYIIRGFTKDDKLITNDPGTRRGEGYLYTIDRILKTNADWDQTAHDIIKTNQVMLVISKSN